MAAGNFGSPMQLIIILAIVVLLFGGKRLRNLGGDIGGAIKGFKDSMSNGETEKAPSDNKNPQLLTSEQPTQVIPPRVEVETNSVKHGN